MSGVKGRDGDALELLDESVIPVDIQVLISAAFGHEGVSAANQQSLVGHLQNHPDIVVALLLWARKGRKWR